MNVLHALLPSALGALLLLLGCTANVEPRRTGAEPLPALVAQRVTATIKREAVRLVRLETAHEAFVTTPEHPFATPRSGWIRAGGLSPGDWVVSERFGAVRLLSVQSEPAARPVPVFNLSVASSHAYFVGADSLHTTRASSSSGPTWQQRLRAIHRAQVELRAQWRARLEERLESTRRHLDFVQLIAFRDAAVVAELTREIALLERELQNAAA